MLRWTIDGADEAAITAVRGELIAALRASNVAASRILHLELCIGALLEQQRTAGHAALLVTLERRRGSAAVHLYVQGRARAAEDPAAIFGAMRVPLTIERTEQSTHICLRLLAPHEEPLHRMKRSLRVDSGDAIARAMNGL